MNRKNLKDFPLNPSLKQFTFEVASEIGISGLGEQQVDILTKTDMDSEKLPNSAVTKGSKTPGQP
ncbi:MAG: hypothetical protein WA118_00815 [Carboxydocellales bacterium]